jgi:hypothetical protein
MIIIHPTTRQRISVDPHCGDIQFDLEGDEAVSNETLKVIGGWTDYTGSGGVPTREQLMFAGLSNELWGTDAAIENAKNFDRNFDGTNTQTHRKRQKRIRKDLKCFKQDFS